MMRSHAFVRAHDLQQSTPGLVFQARCRFSDRQVFVATRKGRIEITNFDHDELTSQVLSSCNGLTLEQHHRDKEPRYFISNRATKQHFDVPPFLKTRMRTFGAAMAYAAAAMEYKVVQVLQQEQLSLVCGILTVGVDKDWTRCVNTQHLSPTNEELLTELPLATQGFLHWTPIMEDDNIEYVLSLNVETEIITQFRGPPCLRQGLRYRYLPMGSYLSLLIARVGFSWDEVWEMKPETGEWAMVASIDLEALKFRFEGELVSASFCRLCPVGWLKLREVLVFRLFRASSPAFTRSFIAYHVRTHEVYSFELEDEGRKSYTHHRDNSLAWLDHRYNAPPVPS